MSIRIKSLNVKNLGPVDELNLDFETFNLIYGYNEKGKSYLVEFIIHSLFKGGNWNIREEKGSGKLSVEGIKNEVVEFTPSSRKKLEDYLTERYVGLPPDFSRLLVIRSTDVELGDKKESDKIILRRYLSHKEILDRIKSNITVSVGEATIEGFNIEADKRANIVKNRKNLSEKIENLDDMFRRVQDEYLSGELKELQDRKEELESGYESLERAKCYLAFKITEKRKELEKKAAQIKEDKIKETLDEVNNFKRKKMDYRKNKQRITELKENAENYEWIDRAINEYIEYGLKEISSKPGISLWMVMFGLAISSAVFFIINIPIISYISLGALIFTFWLYKRKYDEYLENLLKRKELENLKEEYKKRFDEELTNLAQMEVRRKNMEEYYNEMKVIEKQLKEERAEINDLKWKLENKVEDLLNRKIKTDKWENALNELWNKKKTLNDKIHDLNVKLAELNVEPSEFIREKPDVEFDKGEYNNVKESIKKISEKISGQKQKLDDLKNEICKVTGDDFSINWMELIGNLAKKREEITADYENITAEIIGKNIVYKTVEELHEQEDEKIENIVKSDTVSRTLQDVTTRYNKISLEDEKMIVSDPYNSFPVSLLSDGATEQVFLALRIGMAKHWLKKDKLFLILDDAFLHSDYKRRPEIIDKAIELASNGWQIICFTFDDNVRNLINEKAKNLKNRYMLCDLNEM